MSSSKKIERERVFIRQVFIDLQKSHSRKPLGNSLKDICKYIYIYFTYILCAAVANGRVYIMQNKNKDPNKIGKADNNSLEA